MDITPLISKAERIRRLHVEGASHALIAADVGCSQAYVRRILHLERSNQVNRKILERIEAKLDVLIARSAPDIIQQKLAEIESINSSGTG